MDVRDDRGDPMVPLPSFTPRLLSEEELEAEAASLEQTYEHFEIRRRETPTPYHFAVGDLQPLHPELPVDAVAWAMLKRRGLEADEYGRLYPPEPKGATPRIRIGPELFAWQTVEIVFTVDGPQVFLVAPLADRRRFGRLPHWYLRPHPNHGEAPDRYPDAEACVLAPQDAVWVAGRDRIGELLHFVTRHVGALRLWAFGDIGEWPLREASHDALDNLRDVRRDDPCPCGRANKYGSCCRPGDEQRFREELRRGRVSAGQRSGWMSSTHPARKRR